MFDDVTYDTFDYTSDCFMDDHFDSCGCDINPASGLPMIDGDCGGVDVGGNAYGTDSSSFDEF